MKSSNIQGNEWLCRNCNTLVDNTLMQCPQCQADRPEEGVAETSEEGVEEVVERDNYANAEPLPKAKYNFREGVLVNAADITLMLGLFCTVGALIAPMFMEIEGVNLMLWAVCIAVAIFATTMVSWALLRTIADISRMLRERADK
jgi:hypothetical protein